MAFKGTFPYAIVQCVTSAATRSGVAALHVNVVNSRDASPARTINATRVNAHRRAACLGGKILASAKAMAALVALKESGV